MNIGDRVRLLHGREEGVITSFLDNKLVEIEIEDGFRIPVRQSEIVVVASDEEAHFKKDFPEQVVSSRTQREIIATSGIYFAFPIINDTQLALYLVNNTDFDLPYTLGESKNEQFKAVQAGMLKRKNSVKIGELSTQNFEAWPLYIFQALFFREGATTLREPIIRKIKFKANTFFKSKQKAPLLNKDAYLFQIDKDVQVTEVQPEKILDSLFDNTAKAAPATAPTKVLSQPAAEVDLHIEQLVQDHSRMNPAEILEMQLQTFEKAIDNAVAFGMTDITFIHGVGNGKLRTEIHRRLAKNGSVKFFEDAQKEKFGYGATRVKLK